MRIAIVGFITFNQQSDSKTLILHALEKNSCLVWVRIGLIHVIEAANRPWRP